MAALLFALSGGACGAVACLCARRATRGDSRRGFVARKCVLPSTALVMALCAYALCARWDDGVSRVSALAALCFACFHALTDFENGYIYDGAVVASLAVAVAISLSSARWSPLPLLLGAFAGGAPIAAVALLTRGGMGGGDAFLMCGIGAIVGWKAALLTLYCAFIAGGAVAFALLLLKRVDRRAELPFAPFMFVGAACALLFRWTVLERLGICMTLR